MKTTACFFKVSLLVTAAMLAGCSADPNPGVSKLKDSSSSSNANHELIVSRFETDDVSILRIGKVFHKVKDCGSAERLAKLLYAPIPTPDAKETQETLQALNLTEGVSLSCLGKAASAQPEYSAERGLYRILLVVFPRTFICSLPLIRTAAITLRCYSSLGSSPGPRHCHLTTRRSTMCA